MRMGGVASGVIEAALPAPCLHCRRSLTGFELGICRRCVAALVPGSGVACPRCGAPGPELEDDCLGCASDPPPQCATVVWGEYDGVLRSSILAFKHRVHDELAAPFGRRLAAAVVQTSWASTLDAVTWVPSHPLRRVRRGPSAAEQIARVVAHQLRRPAVRSLRRRGLSRQAGTPRASRLRLPASAFSAREPVPRRLLIVDDVLTTGTTLRRAASTARGGGATDVYCAVLARTPDPRRPT